LRDSVQKMMLCVDALVRKGGEDLAANQPNGAFLKWCEADPVRAEEVVSAAQKGDFLAQRFLTFGLAAGNMVKEAERFVAEYTDERRLSGITALGRMRYTELSSIRSALTTLLRAVEGTPQDDLLANALASTLDLADKTGQMTWDEVLGIVRGVSEMAGPNAKFCCARALWSHAKALPEQLVPLLLRPLQSLDPSHKGTIRELDHGLATLLETPHADHAAEFITALFSSAEGALTLSEFPSFGRKLIEGPSARFHGVLISWLLSGNRALCEGLSGLLRGDDLSGTPLNIALAEFHLSPVQQLFLCRKAIGFFFLQPVTAASILISVLRACDDEVAGEVRSLLFEPLLLNYGGTIREYFNGIDPEDRAWPHVKTAIELQERYLTDLRSAGTIKELHPSEHERQIEHLRFHDDMQKAHKEAQKASVLLSLVRRSVLLYGKRSITYVEGPGKERRPVEMELKSHGVTIEMPRMEIVDPRGLDYMLRVFRVERLAGEANHS
jgi:hypothetical protein